MAIIFDSLLYDLVLAIVLLGLCLYRYSTSTFNYWKDRGVSYIQPIPFFGNLKAALWREKSFTEMYRGFYNSKKGERYVGVYEFKNPLLVIRDPELAEQILTKDFVHFYDRGFPSDPEHDPITGNLFGLKGTKWRNLRYKLSPTFTSGKLKGMFEQIYNCGAGLVKYIEEESKINKAIEGKPLINCFTFEVIASVAFGLQLDRDNEDGKRLRNFVEVLFHPTRWQQFRNIIFIMFPKFARTLGLKQMPLAYEVVIPMVNRTLSYRRENNITRNDFLQLLLNLQKQEKEGNFNFQKDLRKDLDYHAEDDVIDQMKHISKGEDEQPLEKEKEFMTDEVIAAQALIFLSAGSESTSSTVNFALYALSQHPQLQKKVHDELDSVLKRNNNKWSYEAVKEMTYLEQVIQETLRMYPVASLLFRVCTKPYKVPGSSLVLDEGVKVMIPVYAIQNDPGHYKSPQEFNPDRFKDNNFKPSSTYFPFGNGPRICIAMRFAALEVKMVLARILSQYSVKLSPKTQLPVTFSTKTFLLAPENEFWFEFDKRVIV